MPYLIADGDAPGVLDEPTMWQRGVNVSTQQYMARILSTSASHWFTTSYKKPRNRAEQDTAWTDEIESLADFESRTCITHIFAKGVVLEIRWPLALPSNIGLTGLLNCGMMYGKTVEQTIHLCDTQDSWQATIKALQPLQDEFNTFDYTSKSRDSQWSSSNLKYVACWGLYHLLAGFLVWQSSHLPMEMGERDQAVVEMHRKVEWTIQGAMHEAAALRREQKQLLTEIAFLLRRFSLMRLPSREGPDKSRKFRYDFALGPHNARVGDVLIPLMRNYISSCPNFNIGGWEGNDAHWETAICLRPITSIESFKPQPDAGPGSGRQVLPLIGSKLKRAIKKPPLSFIDTCNGHSYEEVPPLKTRMVGPSCWVKVEDPFAPGPLATYKNIVKDYLKARADGKRPFVNHVV